MNANPVLRPQVELLFDFDGIFSEAMIYDKSGKNAKIFDFGIRHSFELLYAAGFETINIITGDSSAIGRHITQTFISTLPNKVLFHEVDNKSKIGHIARIFNVNNTVYICDDIYDVILSEFMKVYTLKRKYTQTLVDISGDNISMFDNWLQLTQHLIDRFSPLQYEAVLHNASGLTMIDGLRLLASSKKDKPLNIIVSMENDDESTKETALRVHDHISDNLGAEIVTLTTWNKLRTDSGSIVIYVGTRNRKSTEKPNVPHMFFSQYTAFDTTEDMAKEFKEFQYNYGTSKFPVIWVYNEEISKMYLSSISFDDDEEEYVSMLPKCFK